MGNDHSRQEDKEPTPQVAQRSLTEVATRPTKELVSKPLPVDPRWYETPDTPTSDLSYSDSDLEDATQPTLRSHNPQTFEDDIQSSSQSLHQMLNRFVHGSVSMQLLTGRLEQRWREQVMDMAKSIGFENCHIDASSSIVLLSRPQHTSQMTPETRSSAAHHSIETNKTILRQMALKELDRELEASLGEYLRHNVGMASVVTDHDINAFLLSADAVKRIFQKIAGETNSDVVISSQNRIALIPQPQPQQDQQQQDPGAAEKQEKVIQKGELVWRRLQHWSTNVRKEKKFNIWAKGLPEEVKQRILAIALEIGFETAMVQQNGNIHLEIKPPEGQHRRKLKHATDELRKDLEPIDDAVCENVEEHLKTWLAEFVANQKRRDVLNCRFVLPAEWLRTTSERLANQHGLCVSMETGIELIFHREDVDPKMQDGAGPSGKDSVSSSTNKKTKSSKSKGKKKGAETSGTTVEDGHSEHDRLVQPAFEATLHPLPHAIAGNLQRRSPGRGNNKYGWDPNWPTAHPDRAATTQQRTYG